MIPEGWKYQALEDIASVKRGKFSVRPRNDPSYFGGSTPFVQTGDVVAARQFLATYSQTLNERGVSVSKVFPAGTILITIAANIGDTAITAFPVACPDSVVGIEPKPALVVTKWLKEYLETKKKDLDAQAPQNAQKNINLEVLKPLQILLPPFEEQKQIAEILSTWDQAIEKVEALIANAKSQKKALMQSLLTGKVRLPGFSGEWHWLKFSEVFERVRQKNILGNTNVLTISAQNGLISQVEYFNKSVASEDVRGYTLLYRGDFAYNKSYSDGYPVGAFKPLERYDVGIVSSLYICFRMTNNNHNHDFFRHYFEAGLFNREISAIAQEGARNHGLLNVSVVDFFDTSLHAPSHLEQIAIAEAINGAEFTEQALQTQLTALCAEKSALMQQLLTGKRRVKLNQKEAA
jgi:type I restriction enzyme S subunit